MRVLSNAHLNQFEVTQLDRWKDGPLELRLTPCPDDDTHLQFGALVVGWNGQQTSGMLRDGNNLDALERLGVVQPNCPNFIIAPTEYGYSDLLGMLGSVLPDSVLSQHNLSRPSAGLWLWPICEELRHREHVLSNERAPIDEVDGKVKHHLIRLASTIPAAFEQWIWSELVRSKRFGMRDFASDSSVRLLSGDTRFWMHRLYHVAMDEYETRPPTTHENDSWTPIAELAQRVLLEIPEQDRGSFQVHRPRVGGYLWDPDDPEDRDYILDKLLHGNETMESLAPVVETLLGSAMHEDLSDRFSWVREDFERKFHHKRSPIKVVCCDMLDNCAVHDGIETPGYEDVLFRDLMSFFDEGERRIILALRRGKTRAKIAEDLGHSGHSAVTRCAQRIEAKVKRLLEE